MLLLCFSTTALYRCELTFKLTKISHIFSFFFFFFFLNLGVHLLFPDVLYLKPIQVNFYTDHTKIILCKSSDEPYLLTYISRERVSYTYLLSMLTEMGCTSELRHRLRYVVQLLQHHSDAWEHSLELAVLPDAFETTWLLMPVQWPFGRLLIGFDGLSQSGLVHLADYQTSLRWQTSSSHLPQGFVPIQLMPRRYLPGRPRCLK